MASPMPDSLDHQYGVLREQKIQREAMALSLGVGLVVGSAYSILDVIAFDAEIPHMVVLMSLTYLGAINFANRKYR